MHKALTIAGSDCSGGAGIQADLKTFTAFGVYGMSAITAVVAENTVGVQAVFDLPVDLVREQIRSCITDIGADTVKIGMLSSPEIVTAVAAAIREHALRDVVLDPVMIATSGDPLISEEARVSVREELLPLATVITPNKHEAEVLLGRSLETLDDLRQAARDLKAWGSAWVVVKGGHLTGSPDAIDVAWNGEELLELATPFIDTPHTHGTGCTFSSAIAAGLARGASPADAIRQAKLYVTEAIRAGLAIGHGRGPTNHLVGVTSRW